jgi:RHS repeat-associated protein
VYAYNAVDKRRESVTTTQDGFSYVVSYTYTGSGAVQTVTTPVGLTSYSYDVVSLTNPSGETTTWGYDFTSRAVSQNTNTGSATISAINAYGNTGQSADASAAPLYLRTVQNKVNGQPFSTYELTHSYLGQVTKRERIGDAAGIESSSYVYDDRGRLGGSSLQQAESETADPDDISVTETFDYDLANNFQAGNGWSYNTNNQLTANPASSQYTYDASGNMTSGGLVWNSEGQLQEVGSVSYTYDLQGRRATKSVGGTLVTRYLYDGVLLIAETNAAGQIQRSYTWGAQGLISDNDGTDSRFYLYDGTGNTRALLAANGTALWESNVYSPWGAELSPAAPAPTPFAWNGRYGSYREDASGLLLVGARWYSPALHRFISRDPSGVSGGPNLYAYCSDDPINFFDPTGHSGIDFDAGTTWVANHSTGYVNALTGVAAGCHKYDKVINILGGPAISGLTGGYAGLVDAYGDCGTQQGLNDAGKANGRRLLLARLNVAGQTGLAATAIAGPLAGAIKGRVVAASAECLEAGVGGGCFVAGTKVAIIKATARGIVPLPPNGNKAKIAVRKAVAPQISYVAIEQIKTGDTVVSRDEATGKTVDRKVTGVSVRTSDHLITVALADAKSGKIVETLQATRNHPFFVDGKGWTPAGGLAIGNGIVTRDGPRLVVKSLKWQRRAAGYKVFNFEVEDTHSYFVGMASDGAWVHNGVPCVPGLPGEYLASKAPQQVQPGIKILEGQHVNNLGKVQPWRAHYDEFGRMIGRTDYNAGNIKDGIPDIHHHTYGYFGGRTSGSWMEIGSHLPGEFRP